MFYWWNKNFVFSFPFAWKIIVRHTRCWGSAGTETTVYENLSQNRKKYSEIPFYIYCAIFIQIQP